MTLTAKFAGRCTRCQAGFPAGTVIEWERGKGAMHLDPTACATAATTPQTPTPAPTAVVGEAIALVRFLEAAKARGLKYPKVRFLAPGGGELRLSVAGPTSKYPGSVQVVVRDAWVGRIDAQGVVTRGIAVDELLLAALRHIAENPAAAAAAYGALMGRCTFCNLALTDEGSVEVGYGPICAQRYGLPHAPKGTPMVTTVGP